jgi:hypothetical protein
MRAKVIKALRIVIRAIRGIIHVLGGKICSCGHVKNDTEKDTEN